MTRQTMKNVASLRAALAGAAFSAAMVATLAIAADIPEGMDMPPGVVARIAGVLDGFLSVLRPVFAAFPAIPADLSRALGAIAASASSGGAADIVLGLAGMIALLAAPRALLLFSRGSNAAPDQASRFRSIIRAFLFDAALAAAMIIVAVALHEALAVHATAAGHFAQALVDIGVRYLLAMMVPAILLRPGRPDLRLIACGDETVARLMPWLAVAVGMAVAFIAMAPVLLNAGMRWPTAQALALVIGAAAAGTGYRAASTFARSLPGPAPFWKHGLRAAAVAFFLCWSYGVIRLDFAFFEAIIAAGTVLAAAFVLGRIMAAAAESAQAIADVELREQRLGMAVALRRATHVLAFLALAVIAARWGAAAFAGTAAEARWAATQSSVIDAVIAACIGYCLFEAVSLWIQATFERPQINIMPGEDEDMAPASRISTIAPLLQGVIGFSILAATGLIAVSKLGIDITPVLAGAGILGLAVSFGSQSLVRDIVAGVFYISDDAFRVGEYIEAARLKGTVEKISLRSMRLRHHNGYIHTLPFGQLGSVTNYSRDWVTVKFNLRLNSATDVEQVRKLTKRLGQEMLQDEEYGMEFIQQLKLQGVADVSETALILRFKFTVRPGKPTVVQRVLLKRMLAVFAENGIAFARNSVVVQSEDGTQPTRRRKAAAASTLQKKSPAA
jgi:moderate conductance mechanosensitive channel